jgi:pentatricopeptide repeat protein
MDKKALEKTLDTYTRRFGAKVAFDLLNTVPKSIITPTHYHIVAARCATTNDTVTAVQLCQLIMRHPLPLLHKTFITISKLLFTAKKSSHLVQLYETLKNYGYQPSNAVLVTLISGFTRNGETQQAMKLFGDMPEHMIESVELLTALVNLLCRTSQIEKAIRLFYAVKHKMKLDAAIFAVLISGCTKAKEFVKGAELHKEMLQNSVTTTIEVESALVKMYCTNQEFDQALSVIKNSQNSQSLNAVFISTCTSIGRVDAIQALDMSKSRSPDVVHSMIKMHRKNNNLEQALEVFESLPLEKRTDISYSMIIAACTSASNFGQADKYVSEMKKQNIQETTELQNTLLHLYCKSGRNKLAKQVFDSIQNPDAATYNVMLYSCESEDETTKLLSDIDNKRIPLSEMLCTTLVSVYCDRKMYTKAATLVKLFQTPNIYSIVLTKCTLAKEYDLAWKLFNEFSVKQTTTVHNAHLRLFLSTGNTKRALETFKMMERDLSTYVTAFSLCPDANTFNYLSSQMQKDNIKIGLEIGTAMVYYLCKVNKLLEAFGVVKQASARGPAMYVILLSKCSEIGTSELANDIYTHLIEHNVEQTIELQNTILKSLCTWNKLDDAFELFTRMKHRTPITYNIIITGCTLGKRFDYVHNAVEQLEKSELYVTSELAATLIKTHCAQGNVDKACQVFEHSEHKTDIMYTVLLSGLVNAGYHERAYQIYSNAADLHSRASIELNNTFIKVLCEAGETNQAIKIFKAIRPTEVSYIVLISGLVKQKQYKQIDDICKHITAPLNPNLACALITMYLDRDLPSRAYNVFEEHMKTVGKPTLEMFMLLLCDASSQQFNYEIEQKIITGKLSCELNTSVLILCYARRGQFERAAAIFQEQATKPIYLWYALLSAFKMGGLGTEAIAAIYKMGDFADARAYQIVLSACSHSGLVQEAEALQTVILQRNMLQSIHQVCMVDLYARKGMLAKAQDLALSLTGSYRQSAIMSVIGGCKKHKDAKRGQKMLQYLRGKSARTAAHILVANTYATIGDMEQRELIRSWMNEEQMTKIPGKSYVKIGDEFMSFVVEDNMPDDAIQVLDSLRAILEEKYGYSPRLDCILKPLETYEEKAHHLWRHSEKIALGVALARTEGDIDITKNLRMCLDCHDAAKLISLETNRKILIYDTFRGHIFKDGKCSCNDYY